MKIMKKILCVLLVVLMCVTSAPLSGFVGLELPQWNLKASAVNELAATGQCGDNVYWYFTEDTGVLSISGTGDMWNYSPSVLSPFASCSSLIEKVIIGEGITKIGECVFYTNFDISEVVISDSVTEISEQAFYMCENLTDIVIPNRVTKIGQGAFASCPKLKNVTIGSDVKIIDAGAFYYCRDLEKITIPANVDIIGKGAFLMCYSLSEVVIENGVKTIGDSAFNSCVVLTNISIPESVASIGMNAFGVCEKLNFIEVDENNKYYSNDEDGILFDKSKRTLIRYPINIDKKQYSIPDTVVKIEAYAFSECKNLTEIIVPLGVECIGEAAFSGCTFLTKITLPSSLRIIDDGAFRSCFDLAELTIPYGVTHIGETAFASCEGLKTLVIPDSVLYLGNSALSVCTNLETITISKNISEIGEWTFSGCEKLESITFSNKITSIDSFTFCDCKSLKDVYFYGTEEQWNNIEIDDYNEPLLNATIHFLGEPECTHKETFEQTIPASCTVSGMKFTVCVECGETIGNPEVIPAAHTPGEWETVIEPTYEAEGKKVKKCTVCGETLEEEIIPKLEKQIVEDEETGVAIEIPTEGYDGEVEIEVEESFDGTAFNILDTKTGAVQQKIYDIKMLVNGEAVQPNGKVKVKLPLPAGYNPKFSYVYYVNTETGAVEKMEATYEDGYMVFETDHFSYYAIIAEPDTDNCSCNCHAGGIKKFFFKIGLFFQKIFKKNKQCKCGIYHY